MCISSGCRRERGLEGAGQEREEVVGEETGVRQWLRLKCHSHWSSKIPLHLVNENPTYDTEGNFSAQNASQPSHSTPVRLIYSIRVKNTIRLSSLNTRVRICNLGWHFFLWTLCFSALCGPNKQKFGTFLTWPKIIGPPFSKICPQTAKKFGVWRNFWDKKTPA